LTAFRAAAGRNLDWRIGAKGRPVAGQWDLLPFDSGSGRHFLHLRFPA
jgi:hypothetical protein